MKPKCVLAIETSTRSASVALLLEKAKIIERSLIEKSMQGRELAPCIEALLDSQGIGPDAVDLVVVGIGPGSYTGLRVGIAFARGFACAARCEVKGVSSFAALALQEGADGEKVLTLCRAGQEEFYHALYRIAGDREIEESVPVVGREEAVLALARQDVKIRGEGADAFLNRSFEDVSAMVPRAGSVALLGEREYLDSGPTPEAELLPLYLRRSKAEINWEKRQESNSKSKRLE
ncbi:MAG: tRNA (adenosine(37)-N6)-threonylcarbamoyltransferase complex dimerization subunit type 1 TsaB [Planctomycetota bacterium]|jgi:tRNA threonylcarbamoyladenosine biosynthesis protein TsaB